eukprot:1179744-Prorocentrum_minimum.AAC.1
MCTHAFKITVNDVNSFPGADATARRPCKTLCNRRDSSTGLILALLSSVECERVYVRVYVRARIPRVSSVWMRDAYVRALLCALNFKTSEEDTAERQLHRAIFMDVVRLVGKGRLVDRCVTRIAIDPSSKFNRTPQTGANPNTLDLPGSETAQRVATYYKRTKSVNWSVSLSSPKSWQAFVVQLSHPLKGILGTVGGRSRYDRRSFPRPGAASAVREPMASCDDHSTAEGTAGNSAHAQTGAVLAVSAKTYGCVADGYREGPLIITPPRIITGQYYWHRRT